MTIARGGAIDQTRIRRSGLDTLDRQLGVVEYTGPPSGDSDGDDDGDGGNTAIVSNMSGDDKTGGIADDDCDGGGKCI